MEVNLGVTYVEIYQEELCDLLHVSASSHDLHIREDNKGNTGGENKKMTLCLFIVLLL